MLNPLKFISKFIKSSNQKELDRISKIVVKINSFEEKMKILSDKDFPKKTLEFKERLKKSENISSILPEALLLLEKHPKEQEKSAIMMFR